MVQDFFHQEYELIGRSTWRLFWQNCVCLWMILFFRKFAAARVSGWIHIWERACLYIVLTKLACFGVPCFPVAVDPIGIIICSGSLRGSVGLRRHIPWNLHIDPNSDGLDKDVGICSWISMCNTQIYQMS